MDLFSETTEYVFVGNELWRILIFTGIIALSFFLGKICKFFLNRLDRKMTDYNRLIAAVASRSAAKSITFLFFSFGLAAAITFLNIPDGFESLLNSVLELLVILAIGLFIYRQVDVIDQWLRRFSSEDSVNIDAMLIPIVGKSIRVAVVILIILQAAQSLSDQPITSILAGIGIGGLALGLAAQDTIRNFFGSLMIFADKPFNVGELINLEDKFGKVVEVGVRTTKVRTLEGHMLTIPNGNLANMTIHNIGKRDFIRRVFDVAIPYNTSPDKVDRAVEIIRDILEDHEGMNPDFPPRVFFEGLNSHSLNIKVYYWYHPPDFWQYMAFTETVNREILSRFNSEGIEFAFPTQTIHLAGGQAEPEDEI